MNRLTLPLKAGKKYICRDGEVRLATEIEGMAKGIVDLGGTLVYANTGSQWGYPVHPARYDPCDAVADYVPQQEPKAHPHAASMALYAQDAAETDKPWERWEAKTGDGSWVGVGRHPVWEPEQEYRRKPKTIRIGEYDVPEPLRVVPERGQKVWGVHVSSDSLSYSMHWVPGDTSMTLLCNGMLHLTREAAELHTRALISLTAK